MPDLSMPAAPRPEPASTAVATASAASISDHWYQWIAENRLRECTPESMLATMTAAGLDPVESELAIGGMERDPVFMAARKHQQLQRKLESVVANQQKLWESA